MVLQKLNDKNKLVITIAVDGFDPRPQAVHVGPPVIRRKKEVPPFELSERIQHWRIIRYQVDELPPLLLEAMVLKAWETGLFDEGVTTAPWFPLFGPVIHNYMYINEGGQLDFLPGFTPKGDWETNENLQYAKQLFLETYRDIGLLLPGDDIERKQLT